MHKTLLAVFIATTGALSIPALAQVNLGGAAQVGAGANAGAAVPSAMHAVGQTGAETRQVLHRADHEAKRATHKATNRTRSTVERNGAADADVNAGTSIGLRSGSTHAKTNADAHAGASVDTGAAANRAGQVAQGAGGLVSDTAHSAIRTTGRAAGSIGDAANPTAAGRSIGAGAKVDADASANGH